MMGRALLVVRAELKHASDRSAFDRWYENEHLPQALAIFAAERAWRGWSTTAKLVHFAFYEFADLNSAQAALNTAGINTLIAEFDRHWGSRSVRERQILEIVQQLPA